MSAITDRAVQLYMEEGYCCAEAIWLAFAEDGTLSEEDKAFGNKLSFAFCGGTGAKNLCGAAAGGALVLGSRFGRIPGEPRNEDLPKYTKALLEAFEEHYTYTTCRELKSSEDPNIYKQVCKEYVSFVTAKVEELLEEGVRKEKCSSG